MNIGEYQTLKVARDTPHGLFLTDGESDVLLPGNQCPPNLQPGDEIEVFLYTDSEDRPIATTRRPLAVAGEFAYLKVVAVAAGGAFFDWGLDKDLFCPRSQQRYPLREGHKALVRVYLDQASKRVVCTTKIERFLQNEGTGLSPGQKVGILVSDVAEDAVRAIVDGRYKGTLFPDELHEELRVGDRREAYVKAIRESDQRIALSLRPQGFAGALAERERVLGALREAGGTLRVSDRSSPAEIQRMFGMSKGAFKKLIGALYREKLIELSDDAIRLAKNP